MRVAHINVRLSEGGAANVAVNLHQRLRERGIGSRMLYGYGPGARDSPQAKGDTQVVRISRRSSVMANFLSHELLGVDLFPPTGRSRERLVEELRAADVVHLHVVHSYFLPFSWLFSALTTAGRPVVWTTHDRWLMTGRCAIPGACERWRTGCGSCPAHGSYPRGLLDLSARTHKAKRRRLEPMTDLLTLVCPSDVLAREHEAAFPSLPIHVISNGLDPEFEAAAAEVRAMRDRAVRAGRPRVLIVAHDLRNPVKTNWEWVRQLLASGEVIVETVGRNSPISGANVVNHGHVSSRANLAKLIGGATAFLSTSVVESFGLLVAEALACGTPVIAADSPASREVLGQVGGRPVAGPDEALALLKSGNLSELVGGNDTRSVALRAQAAFSGARMCDQYIGLYEDVLMCAPRHEPTSGIRCR
jgi:putative colanic acid biosynthesis glycosyltransferase